MKNHKTIGYLLITGAFLLFVPYTILTIIFDYPDILRQETGTILTKFHNGGSRLILVWWLFAFVGLPLLIAYILIGQALEAKLSFIRWITSFGVIGLAVQMIGLLRWVFVVPVLANSYSSGSDATKEASKITFQVIHQYGGVVLGEHIGQLFTITWSIAISYSFSKLKFFPAWVNWLGYLSSLIYLLAQSELFATVIPDFPVIDLAGLVGSTLWLIWLIILGIKIKNLQL